jgi:hypothetical protein
MWRLCVSLQNPLWWCCSNGHEGDHVVKQLQDCATSQKPGCCLEQQIIIMQLRHASNVKLMCISSWEGSAHGA